MLQRLFVAQTDNIETSSCLITPPEVKYVFSSIILVKLLIEKEWFLSFTYNFLLISLFFSFMLNGKGVERRTNVLVVCVLPLNCVEEIYYLRSFPCGFRKKEKETENLDFIFCVFLFLTRTVDRNYQQM